MSREIFKQLWYTLMILVAVAVSLLFPQWFTNIGGFKLSKLIVPLLQVIMFGMGTVMSLQDFAGVVKQPKAVLVGLGCQFVIMPGLGYGLAKSFGFAPEVAAGILLIGCSPSGMASNVMSYIARANVALSITLTALATLLAPVLTPLLMKTLAGELVEVSFWKMMWDIVQIVILPIGAGALFNHFLMHRFTWLRQVMPVVSMVGIGLIITIITASGRDSLLNIGWLLLLAVLLHNLLGYVLGYGVSRLLGFNERDCRTIAIEVGLQNGGLASGLALQMGKVATVGLAPAIFGPVMNITGSMLASWWRTRPSQEAKEPA
jgi:bile acid:Na+ symporter, BASS family